MQYSEHIRVGVEYMRILVRKKILALFGLEPIILSKYCILYPYYTTNGDIQYFPFIKRSPKETFTSLQIDADDEQCKKHIGMAAGPYKDFYQIPIDIKYFYGLKRLVLENEAFGKKVVIPEDVVEGKTEDGNEWHDA